MKNIKGSAAIIAIIIILGATSVGLYYQFMTNEIDSPIEQVVEKVLDSEGIEVDFSADKKKNQK